MANPTTFGDLRSIIERDLGADVNNDISTEITNSMHAAIKFYEGEPLWWLMTTAQTFTTSGDSSDSLPSDLIDIESVMIASTWIAEAIPFDRFNSLRTSKGFPSGKPQFYTTLRAQVFWYPTPDDAHQVDWYYWRRLPELSVGDSDSWITEGWRLIRSHVEADLATHLLHSPPQDPAAYLNAAQGELISLLKRSFGKVPYGQTRINQRLAELQAGKSRA